jgi:hypothetical protein
MRIVAKAGPVPRADSRHTVPCVSIRTSDPRKDSPAAPAYTPCPLYRFHGVVSFSDVTHLTLPKCSPRGGYAVKN